MKLKKRRRAGRPSDPALAIQLIDVGWTMFLERGVEAVAVEAITARAGVSKATFYKHFADKAALFEAAVKREMERIEAAQQLPFYADPPTSIEATLRQFGTGLMTFLFSPGAVDFYNALSAELARHKSLARKFYDLGPGRTHANLAAILDRAVRDGDLVIPEPDTAAEHLIGLWQGISNYQLSLGISVDSIRATIPHRVDAGLQVFFAAYRAGR
jgi:TetR/AcrR family transcriptional repressor of mexJK operon